MEGQTAMPTFSHLTGFGVDFEQQQNELADGQEGVFVRATAVGTVVAIAVLQRRGWKGSRTCRSQLEARVMQGQSLRPRHFGPIFRHGLGAQRRPCLDFLWVTLGTGRGLVPVAQFHVPKERRKVSSSSSFLAGRRRPAVAAALRILRRMAQR